MKIDNQMVKEQSLTQMGESYVGEWKDGLPYGQGTSTFPDGRMYVGNGRMGYHMVKEQSLTQMGISM